MKDPIKDKSPPPIEPSPISGKRIDVLRKSAKDLNSLTAITTDYFEYSRQPHYLHKLRERKVASVIDTMKIRDDEIGST